MLESFTINYFLPYVISDAGPVNILDIRRLRSIHSWMKEIHVVPIQYVTLEFWPNDNLILTLYKLKIVITTSIKITLMVRTIFIFIH